MNKKLLLGVSFTAVAVMMFASPALANEIDAFSAVAKVEKKNIDVVVNSVAPITETGAYGFGVITDAGLDGILVTTTHGGIKDSEAQTDASDASFHNHYVALQPTEDGSGLCAAEDGLGGLEVKDITFGEPGDVSVIDDVAVFDGPTKFKSTHSLTGDKIKFDTHGPVGAVVAFTITPIDSDGEFTVDTDELAAVCITVTSAADPLVDNSVLKNKHHDDDD